MEIKEGSTRMVFLVGRFAIKIPSIKGYRFFIKGILGNLNERRFHKHNIFYNKRLAKIQFSDPLGFIVVMERLSKCELSTKELELIKAKYKLPCEIKNDSWGYSIKDGIAKCIDYGDM